MSNAESKNIELLRKIKAELNRLKDKHDSAYFSFMGFIVAIAGVLIGVDSITLYLRYVLGFSMISFIIGIYLYLEGSSMTIKKVENIYNIIEQAIDNNTSPSQELEDNKSPSKREGLITESATRCLSFGLILFLIGILRFTINGG